METTNRAESTPKGGRTASGLAAVLREDILGGSFGGGQFLPTERELAVKHRVAKMTARRALKLLEREGLTVAEPRQGYRVLGGAADPDRGLPVAYIANRPEKGSVFWDEFHKTLLAEFQRVAAAKGWSLLAVSLGRSNCGEVMEQVRSAGVCGVVLDIFNLEVIARLREVGIPVVVVDGWVEDVAVDMVNQDGFLGGVQAASYLAARGHRRIGWFGAKPVSDDLQIIERYGGAVGGLERFGLKLDPRLCVRTSLGERDVAVGKAEKLLSRKDRPTAVLTLWQEMTAVLVEAARNLGLSVGGDLELVGWSTEEGYESGFLPNFNGGAAPPAVVWSVARMAETAVRCLKQRRADPEMPPVHVKVPTRLKLCEDSQE